MDSNEEGKSIKSDKPSTAAVDQSNVQVYHHDWAAMQAYYGSRVAIPQYFNSNVAASHPPPPYMWPPPSPMMAPYGSPYSAFFPPGGVYAHPGIQTSSQSQGPISQDTPAANSPGNTDNGFIKKLKEYDGLAISIKNNKVGDSEQISEPRSFQSSENDDSSNGSDGNTTGGEKSRRKRSRDASPTTDGKLSSQTTPPREENAKHVTTMVAPVMSTAMDFQNSAGMNNTPQPCHEVWNEKEVKREKRKQSNRESARRSRLRKQAEAEELSVKVDALVAENMTLRSKLSQVNDESNKLRLENEALLEQLKSTQTQATGKTENLISGVDKNNSLSTTNNNMEHQLLNVSLRTDSVAAS